MQGTTNKETEISNSRTEPKGVDATRCRLALAAGIACLFLASGCGANRASQSFVFDGDIEDIVVDLESGDVVVTGNDEGRTEVEVDLICRGGAPEYAVDAEGGRVNVVGRANWRGEEACGGTVRISTPRDASIDVSVGQGDVAVAGVEGEVAIETFDGDIECDAPDHQVEITTYPAVATAAPSFVIH
jgi:hypothetical protein